MIKKNRGFLLSLLLVFGLLGACNSSSQEQKISTPTKLEESTKAESSSKEAKLIFSAGKLTTGYDMGVASSGELTDWVTNENDAMCMAYPSGQDWGAVFITVGKPKQPPRPSQDLSNYQNLSLELQGKTGGESILIGLKDKEDPSDGKETLIPVSNLTTDWQTFTFRLSDFKTADLSKLYIVTEFVFKDTEQTENKAQKVCFRNIKYLP